MKKISFYNILLLVHIGLHAQEYEQPMLVNNKIIETGTQDCSMRYHAIKPLLKKYSRPFTVLLLGADIGYYAFKIAHNYQATCVMTEEKNIDTLLHLCQLNQNLHNLIVLQKTLSLEELRTLGECEHFDVVIALNTIHEQGKEWENYAQAILTLGDHTIIELPPHTDGPKAKDYQKIYDYFMAQESTILARPPVHKKTNQCGTLFLCSKIKKKLMRKYWIYKKTTEDEYEITSTFATKKLLKKRGNVLLDWQPGINLLTFKTLNGVYPQKETIYKQLEAFKNIKHTDLHIWNIIIQGEQLITIDGDDRRLHYKPSWTLPKILQQFKKRIFSMIEF